MCGHTANLSVTCPNISETQKYQILTKCVFIFMEFLFESDFQSELLNSGFQDDILT